MSDTEAPEKESMIGVGKVVSAHGVAGAVKVASDAAAAGFFSLGRRIFLEKGNIGGWFTVEGSLRAGRFTVVRLHDVTDRTRAGELAGSVVLVPRASLPPLEEGEYYWSDIIGLKVVTVSGKHLGRVDSIIETGANDVYVVKDDSGGETLLPALPWVIITVDLAAGVMTVEPPEGL